MARVGLYSRRNPFFAPLLRVRRLTGERSEKDTRHLEFSLGESGLEYKPGDSLGIVPDNRQDLVDEIISLKGFDPEQEVRVKEETISLRQALIREYDICNFSGSFLKWVASIAASPRLASLLLLENQDKVEDYLYGRHVIDILREYPEARFPTSDLLAHLKPLQPRLYSISSSLLAHPGEVHLTVDVVQYTFCERERCGVCSGYLAFRIEPGSSAPVFLHSNRNFFLPEDGSAPIIMVGPGTGIAPFRAFLEERRALGASGKNWLFFGNPHQVTDFLYEEELAAMQKLKVLTWLDTAFSRDQAEKIYVQHRMLEHADELYAWLQEGAYFYVCGDAKHMAKDVHAALLSILQKAGGMDEDQAQEYAARLGKEKRYQKDVY